MTAARCVRTFFSLVVVFSVSACGSTKPTTRATVATAPAVAKETPPKAEITLPMVRLGEEAELKGFTGVHIAETDLSVLLKKTRWSEIEIDGKAFHDGYAELTIRWPDEEKTVRVDADYSVQSRGYDIEVTYIGTAYDENTGRKIPHAKVVVKRLP